MMKIKSFKDVETYIYTSIVLPLKGLNLPELNFSSPITDDMGAWDFKLERTPAQGPQRRNYQRSLAQQNRNWWIVLLRSGLPSQIIGEYNIRSHFVKLWQEPFKEAGAMPLFGKLYEALDTNSPFTKVIIETGEPPEYPSQVDPFADYRVSVDSETDDTPF